jgi:hypothetical protein
VDIEKKHVKYRRNTTNSKDAHQLAAVAALGVH